MINIDTLCKQIRKLPPSDQDAVTALVMALTWSTVRDVARRKMDEVREVYVEVYGNLGEDND